MTYLDTGGAAQYASMVDSAGDMDQFSSIHVFGMCERIQSNTGELKTVAFCHRADRILYILPLYYLHTLPEPDSTSYKSTSKHSQILILSLRFKINERIKYIALSSQIRPKYAPSP